jgi:hypothetical protein
VGIVVPQVVLSEETMPRHPIEVWKNIPNLGLKLDLRPEWVTLKLSQILLFRVSLEQPFHTNTN